MPCRCILSLATFVVFLPVCSSASEYDPLAVPETSEIRTHDLVVQDEARDREIPVLVYLPDRPEPAPVVLFSHGLGGARTNCAYIGRHWAVRGYAAVFLQHPGSDESVWKVEGLLQRLAAVREAASSTNFLRRVRDVPAVLDSLEAWNEGPMHPLAGRLDLQRIGMSGHSFGAVTTQATSGQRFQPRGPNFTDARIKAAVAMSPSCPLCEKAERCFENVRVPWLVLTGTDDNSPVGKQTVETRMNVFSHLPPGDKFAVVLHEAEHSAFAEKPLPGDQNERNPNHHRAVLGLTTAFWDAYLRADADAKAWLAGDGPRSLLEEEDCWRAK